MHSPEVMANEVVHHYPRMYRFVSNIIIKLYSQSRHPLGSIIKGSIARLEPVSPVSLNNLIDHRIYPLQYQFGELHLCTMNKLQWSREVYRRSISYADLICLVLPDFKLLFKSTNGIMGGPKLLGKLKLRHRITCINKELRLKA